MRTVTGRVLRDSPSTRPWLSRAVVAKGWSYDTARRRHGFVSWTRGVGLSVEASAAAQRIGRVGDAGVWHDQAVTRIEDYALLRDLQLHAGKGHRSNQTIAWPAPR